MTLARSEPHEIGGELTPMDLAAAAAAAAGLTDTHDLVRARHIDLSLDAPPNILIQGDREVLRTLVRNLVDNAVRYTPRHGSVRVSCRRTTDGPLLEVTDTGPRIPASDRERVFDRSIDEPTRGRGARAWDLRS